jgi:hypothetical protein
VRLSEGRSAPLSKGDYVNFRSPPTDSYRVEGMRGDRPAARAIEYFSSLGGVICPKRSIRHRVTALRSVPHSMERVGWARFRERWGLTRLRAAPYWVGCHLSFWPDIIFIVANAALAGVEGKDQPELCRIRAMPFRTPSARDRWARSDFRLDLNLFYHV